MNKSNIQKYNRHLVGAICSGKPRAGVLETDEKKTFQYRRIAVTSVSAVLLLIGVCAVFF